MKYTEEHKRNITNIVQNYFTGHKVHTPWELVEAVVNQIKTENKKIAVLYNVEWVFNLIFDKGVSPKNITMFGDCDKKRKLVEAWGVTYINAAVLLDKKTKKEYRMKFDVIVGNPPFNVREKDDPTITGVSGKTDLFKDFVKLLPDIIKPDGIIGFITPKGIVKTLLEYDPICNYDVIDFNLMSEKDYWKYDTCYFILTATEVRNSKLVPTDPVLNKILDLSMQDNWKCLNLNKSDKELVRENIFGNGIECIRYLPGKRGKKVTLDQVANTKYLIPEGPKVVGTHLNSVSSITATDLPVCAGTTISIPTNTLEEAQALSLFIKNNKAVKYFQKQAKVKKLFIRLNWFKKFDLSQIVTGYEYPVEWQFDKKDIELVENA